MTLRLAHPSTILVAGPTGCGKTYFVAQLLHHGMFDPAPAHIRWVYSEWQPLYDQVQMRHPYVEFIQGLSEDLYKQIDSQVRNLVILDDQMSEAGDSKQLAQLFTKGSHHKNLTVAYIVQNLFDQGKSMRTVSVNSQYMVVFKSPRDKTQIQHLSRQMYPGNSKFLVQAFEDATQEERYGYLLMDLRPESENLFRIRTKIFPNQTTIVYLPLDLKPPIYPTGYKSESAEEELQPSTI